MAKTSQSRACQPCTACCDGWLQIRIHGTPVVPGRPCQFSTGTGCSNYAHRPMDPCVRFVCAWRADGSPLPDWMRPDNSKVIVLFNQDSWRGMPVDIAVPVGRRIPTRALNFLKQFAQANGRPLLYAEQIVRDGTYTNQQAVNGYGPSEFQREMAERTEGGEMRICSSAAAAC